MQGREVTLGEPAGKKKFSIEIRKHLGVRNTFPVLIVVLWMYEKISEEPNPG